MEDLIANNFFSYLSKKLVSSRTLKDYKSDLNSFVSWLGSKARSLGLLAENLSEIILLIDLNTADDYKAFLLRNNNSIKTINRRLSTLRHLSRFLLNSQILDFNFTQNLENISEYSNNRSINPLIREFGRHLELEKVSKNTVKNYLSDIKHFLNWLETNSTL